MTPRFEYVCDECDWMEATSSPQGDDMGDCSSPRCDGTMRRVWSVGFIRSTCRAVPK